VLGGATAQATLVPNEDGEDQAVTAEPTHTIPVGDTGTLAALLELMDNTYDDLTMLGRMLSDPAQKDWVPLLTSLDATAFATVRLYMYR